MPISAGPAHQPGGPSRPAPPMAQDLPSLQDIFERRVPTMRHIPHRARNSVAQSLTRCLALVVVHNTTEAWQNLLMFPKSVLSMPAQKARNSCVHLGPPRPLGFWGASDTMGGYTGAASTARNERRGPSSSTRYQPLPGGLGWQSLPGIDCRGHGHSKF